MPATVTTTELFSLSTPEGDIKTERDLRIKAGAIRSSYTKDAKNWILTTEWNVLGQNDP